MVPDDNSGRAMDSLKELEAASQDGDPSSRILSKTDDLQDINDNDTKPATPSRHTPIPSSNNISMTNGDAEDDWARHEKVATIQSDASVGLHIEEKGDEDYEEDGRYFSEDEDKLVINETNDRHSEGSSETKTEDQTLNLKINKLPNKPEKRFMEEGSELEHSSKRPRPLDDLVSLQNLNSVTQVQESLIQNKKDIEALEILLKQKEEEWNTILRLKKRKEEIHHRLLRRKDVIMIEGNDPDIEVSSKSEENMSFLPQGQYSSVGGAQIPLLMMNQLISNQFQNDLLYHKSDASRANKISSNIASPSNNVSVIDIHTSSGKSGIEPPRISMSAEAQSKLSKQLVSSLSPARHILPKPSGGGIMSPSSGTFGPQGPLVSVQQLIANHRKENPKMPPIRGAKRGAWRNKYDGEKRSSSREPERPSSVSSSSSDADIKGIIPNTLGSNQGGKGAPPSNSPLNLSDPSVSYKDVLLQFAQLTQSEKSQPGSPQISIIPVVSGDSTNIKRSESSREMTPSSRELTPTSTSTTLIPSSVQPTDCTSALAKLLLERSNVNTPGAQSDATANEQYLTLSALLSGGITTTVKDKANASTVLTESRKKSVSISDDTANPRCQGCNKHKAQFVCAGCGNQWYCSKECQVNAWDSHSDFCK